MSDQHVDELLEQYLTLLDEYVTLRETLSKAQVAMYHDLARANFSAERGVRYGRDYYDERMQASRILSITVDDEGRPDFQFCNLENEKEGDVKTGGAEPRTERGHDGRDGEEPKVQDEDDPEQQESGHGDEGETKEEMPKQEKQEEKKKKPSRDPLRWYGILAPMPLRQAQAHSIRAVEGLIPRLVTVDAAMQNLEIRVRRARKKRAKAAAAAAAATAANQAPAEESPAQVASVEAT